MLYEMACQAAWDRRRVVYFKITRGKVDFLFHRKESRRTYFFNYIIIYNQSVIFFSLNEILKKQFFSCVY